MALDDDVGRPWGGAGSGGSPRRHGAGARRFAPWFPWSLGTQSDSRTASSATGVELRVSKPITRAQRRWRIQATGPSQASGGRWKCRGWRTEPLPRVNTGFGEGRLTPGTTWRVCRGSMPARASRALPWPHSERSFLKAWTDAGGAPFDIRDAGRQARRRRVSWWHRGLRDANTIEAYLADRDSRSMCTL